MSAQIIRFPGRTTNDDAKGRIGDILRDSIPLANRDAELAMLMTMAEHLLANYTDGLCDSFLDRVEQWERDNKRA